MPRSNHARPARASIACTLVLALPISPLAHATSPSSCRADSGPQRLPLVELYTSEGCSSCPPADRRLQALARAGDPALAPVAWHVAYWDHLGWRDPYASPSHGERQRRAVALAGGRTVYTPQFFVSGREVRDPGLVATEALRVARSPARAALSAVVTPGGAEGWTLAVSARAPAQPSLQLVVTLTESDLSSSVTAGENAGERLRHGHVVRHSWTAPLADDGSIGWRQAVQVTPAQSAKGLDLIAFVQDLRNGEVLQALRVPGCHAPSGG